MRSQIKMVITDLDGTLLNSHGKISKKNLETLKKLGEIGVIRVFATGRSMYSCRRAVDINCPHDYIAFSTGAGVFCKNTDKILYAKHIAQKDVLIAIEILKNESINFCVSQKIPENHRFFYHQSFIEDDFAKRLKIYESFCQPLEPKNIGDSVQLIAIFAQGQEHKFETIKQKILEQTQNINIIKATSPQNGKNIWLEIYPKNISKKYAVEYIAKLHNINKNNILGIGNDYNDIDFLDFCGHSFVTNNAPKDLRKKYNNTDSNDDDGFSQALKQYFNFFEN